MANCLRVSTSRAVKRFCVNILSTDNLSYYYLKGLLRQAFLFYGPEKTCWECRLNSGRLHAEFPSNSRRILLEFRLHSKFPDITEAKPPSMTPLQGGLRGGAVTWDGIRLFLFFLFLLQFSCIIFVECCFYSLGRKYFSPLMGNIFPRCGKKFSQGREKVFPGQGILIYIVA